MRADSGFAREEIMAWCEQNAVYCCLGLARNKRPSFGELYQGIKTRDIQVPCRRFEAFAHLMLSVLRTEVLRGTDLAAATLGQIRLKLFKIGARITISCRRIHLSS